MDASRRVGKEGRCLVEQVKRKEHVCLTFLGWASPRNEFSFVVIFYYILLQF